MTREEFHDMIDEQLTKMGFKDKVEVEWGSIMLQVNWERGKAILTIRERSTSKESA